VTNIVPRTNENSYVKIISDSGCSSYIGRTGKPGQTVSLNNRGCMRTGTIQHELIHALGFDHMQSHKARDNFVTIVRENIKQGAGGNFDKVNPKLFGNFDTPYDYGSVMHYSPNAFTKNGKP
jgi:hypothetical protein